MSTLPVEQVLVLTKWTQKWLKFSWDIIINGGPTEQLAKRILKNMDLLEEEPSLYVEDVLDERVKTVVTRRTKVEKGSMRDASKIDNTNTLTSEMEASVTEEMKYEEDVARTVISRKVSQKLMKGKRSNFAAAVAKKAYNKFGERVMSPANIMVTRKWIQKYLEDSFKDLRTCDKNLAIDRALFLSFVPTKDFLKMRIILDTSAAQQRMEGGNLFGRIFRLAGPTL